MMNDINDLLTQIDLFALIEKDLGQPHQKSSRWALWVCPFHPDKKTPSLGVNLQDGHWHCFGCKKGGNAITWMCAYHRMRYEEALAVLGISDHIRADHWLGNGYHDAPKNIARVKEEKKPSSIWQTRGLAFLTYARNQLWQTPDAIDYLREQRLLEDATIQHFGLGYNPSDVWDSPERWGLSKEDAKRIWLPKGYVIPCFVEHSLWYIKIRRLIAEPKYMHVRGSAPAMFGTDSIDGAPLVLLTEGEFDCMLTWQLLKDIAGVVTLGSASKKLDLAHWTRYLLPAEEIIAVLDNDTAGKLGAQSLAGLSAQIYPVRIPSLSATGKDITDYVQAGGDLWAWLKHHLVRIENPNPIS
jgi:DNA primase